MKKQITATAANGSRVQIDAAAVVEFSKVGSAAKIWAQVGCCEYRQFLADDYNKVKQLTQANDEK